MVRYQSEGKPCVGLDIPLPPGVCVNYNAGVGRHSPRHGAPDCLDTIAFTAACKRHCGDADARRCIADEPLVRPDESGPEQSEKKHYTESEVHGPEFATGRIWGCCA